MNFNLEYNDIEEDYSDFLREVKRTVEKLLLKNKIPIAFGVSDRLKSLNSINEKNNSKRHVIIKSITELNDLVGIRIVLLFNEYKEKIKNIILEEFKPISDPKVTHNNINTFGYNSFHLIVGIKDEWLTTLDWGPHSNKKIEIQIRTLSEHIWAETSHALFYKRDENIPDYIKRDLYRLSAILEVVDEKIQSFKDNVSKHVEYIQSCPYEEVLKMDLNAETFRRIMTKNSNGIYNENDKKNKILSSDIESIYNILNCVVLESLIANKIDLKGINSDKYIKKVLELLEINKYKIGETNNTHQSTSLSVGIFLISKRENGEFQFRLKASNGETILNSEGYSTKSNCLNGIDSVKRNALDYKKYDRRIASNGKFYFTLEAANGQIIGISEVYETEIGCNNGIVSVRNNAPISIAHDLTV